jgi:uncharacterized membrane protein YheB (UPF0754 family)
MSNNNSFNLYILFKNEEEIKSFIESYEHTVIFEHYYYDNINEIYCNIELFYDRLPIELQLDELRKEYKDLRYMILDNNYRIHINKKGKKIVTKKATKYIGLV